LNRRGVIQKILLYASVIIISLFIVFPFFYVIISSIQPHADLVGSKGILPHTITFKNYITLLTGRSSEPEFPLAAIVRIFPYSLRNSCIVAMTVTLICLLAGSLSAYTFTRLDFKGKNKLFITILFSRMVPGVAILIPMYIIMRTLMLVDTILSLIIVHISFSLPFAIWMLRAYFESIPRDIEEAALVDGCSRIGAIFRVILPLSVPGLIVTGIFCFMTSWNDFLFALVLTNTKAALTAPVVASMFITEFYTDYGLLTAVTVLAAIPPVTLALIFQKYIIKGLTLGWGK